ncbi:Ubiquinol-cytochrome c reductase iron-sulfur subunit [BD1-7 clade bacterium]|uniref:Ubiquinol-cytochrome c reductase iron-sulfur subunit n=1 Tax=BD1-7 clade bacterium TaxID=2029982 RepID=A0A5S9QD09_9GAMM|nr:Ubiquinol-cytochrome c reductase iron-sulfur subunit [BD1-7 clade bacterium]CAA0114449.1 Ubiquinol-cytochrome c reductase iron-sulfur subunit [BD1-7 clade bacterium]CAA0115407.1 Ubiquinol-cytochrome c reductase iron-sulfur subunit [BD1-7 clade bacterium]
MSNDGVNTSRRRFLATSTAVVGAAGAVGVAVPFLGSWAPSAKAKAAGAPVKADMSKLRPGELITVEWRGKPVYVMRRTEAQLKDLPSLNDQLRDPESNASNQPEYAKNIDRSIKPEYSVLIGLCTHLGCAPKPRPEVAPADLGADWKGGFFCPCHGSKFDLAGRVYKGVPAPTNLEVPPYKYESELVITIGVDGGAA